MSIFINSLWCVFKICIDTKLIILYESFLCKFNNVWSCIILLLTYTTYIGSRYTCTVQVMCLWLQWKQSNRGIWLGSECVHTLLTAKPWPFPCVCIFNPTGVLSYTAACLFSWARANCKAIGPKWIVKNNGSHFFPGYFLVLHVLSTKCDQKA